jgi:hypothetical protein
MRYIAIMFLAYVAEQAIEAWLGMPLGIIGVFVYAVIALAIHGLTGGDGRQGGGS